MLTSTSLTALADEHLAAAREAHSGRSALTLHGGREHPLRQTLLAMAAGQALSEHESPGEATLQVLQGTVTLTTPEETWRGSAGDFLAVPRDRHDLAAEEDAVVLLTVALEQVHED
jgi:quercetin dioxygenase-like cupin family protein